LRQGWWRNSCQEKLVNKGQTALCMGAIVGVCAIRCASGGMMDASPGVSGVSQAEKYPMNLIWIMPA
jgi:hypothetical protein